MAANTDSLLLAIKSFSVLLSTADAFHEDLYLQSEEDESILVAVTAQARLENKRIFSNKRKRREEVPSPPPVPPKRTQPQSTDTLASSRFAISGDFENSFKINRQTFEFLMEKIGHRIGRKEGGGGGRLTVPVDKQILVAAWLLTSTESFKAVGDRFHINKSVVHTSVYRVVSALNELSDEFIRWPKGNNLLQISNHFEQMKGIPGVIGIIDAFHVDIRAPPTCSEDFFNDRKSHSVIVVIVCDHKCQLTHFWTGPGALQIAQLYRNSPLHEECSNDSSIRFPNDTHLLGSKAFPLEPWLLTPFPGNHEQTPVEINYNICHNATQAISKKTLCILKSRFRRLRSLYLNRIGAVYKTIGACCVFHNICLQQKSTNIELEKDADSQSDNEDVNMLGDSEIGLCKREKLAQKLFKQSRH